ncbi:hypothetical protein EA798_03915 [Pseudomonas songnenensis]|uniref:Uncharacterized protein n=1 Tax=Pseudomonas songnenensis TaxID=1176259 RepID=A0ABX9V2A2_9PSED|nr:hypothetical protein EA798_03915 [Pseudomonas songnenensis]
MRVFGCFCLVLPASPRFFNCLSGAVSGMQPCPQAGARFLFLTLRPVGRSRLARRWRSGRSPP